jgi:Ca2+-binding RTX toxin-like protein
MNIIGTNGNDVLIGEDESDWLVGLLGDDTLNGGGDVDWASYSDANGSITANLATGLATGADGNDTLINIENINGSAFNDTLTGDAGDNSLSGNDGNDTLLGGDGRDYLKGGAGVDYYDGGNGSDTAFFEDGLVGLVINLKTGVVANDGFNNQEQIANVENLHGTYQADYIQMGDSGGYVFGRSGNDTLIGGLGNDNFIGGSGNDSIVGGDGSDNVDYFNDDFDGGSLQPTGVTVDLANGFADDGWGDKDTLSGIENIVGSRFNDALIGDANNNRMNGRGGDDTLIGGSGDDVFNGGSGNDNMIGGDGIDFVNYLDDGYNDGYNGGSLQSTGVVVDLARGTASDGWGSQDSLSGIENVGGSSFDDVLTGDTNNNYFRGNTGNDTLDGGSGYDWADYRDANGSVTVNLTTGSSTGADGNDTLINMEDIGGGSFNDTLTGDAGDNTLRGREGDDTLDGGAGYDRVDYRNASGSVTVSLVTGTSTGADGNDTFTNMEAIGGGAFNDILTGDAGINYLRGQEGDDTLDGGGGSDSADYKNAIGSVTVNLATGRSSGADGNDTLISIEEIGGSSFDDTLTGDTSDNFIRGQTGNDTIDGGAGFDWIDYRRATGSVTVSLATGQSSGADGNDSFINVEAIGGSSFNDILIGNAENNTLRGREGDDTLDGGVGSDVADYRNATGSVTVNLDTGLSSGADGNDTLISIEHISGSIFNDILTGDAGDNFLNGRLGDDTLDGGANSEIKDNLNFDGDDGFDWAAYTFADGAVSVNLSTGLSSGADGNDTLINIEAIRGSAFDDNLTGNSSANFLRGGLGNDTLDGGAGIDWADYRNAASLVNVSLLTGKVDPIVKTKAIVF